MEKIIVQGVVDKVYIAEKTGRMLDIYGVDVKKDSGETVTVLCEAAEGLDDRLRSGMKVVSLAYRVTEETDGKPCDKIIVKTLNY
ncbi:MAG: hypothetical protein NC120_06660 [Ruminococcus sp.]|nr:hypothetical protein [Ruminococcus sp.]